MRSVESKTWNAVLPAYVHVRLALVLMAVVVAATGCSVRKNMKTVALPDDLPRAWTSSAMSGPLPVTDSLLALIGDDVLRELVDEALRNNPDLSATALRLQASEHLLYGPKSRMMPKVNAGFAAEKNNQAESTSGRRKTGSRHRISLGLSWEIDLWGRLADEYAAARQTVLSESEDHRLARDALAARVIQAWIDQVAIRRSVAIETERVAVIGRIETVLVERFRSGIGSLDELSAAKSRTEIARADLSARETDLLRSVRKLEVLLGRYPTGALISGTAWPAVAPPRMGIPADALLNRPDVRAAMARVESARRTAAAASKARLPALELKGQVFKTSARLGQLGGSTAWWDILGTVFQPLFEGGRLKNEAVARKLTSAAELTALRQVLLTAVGEVEDVLDASRDLDVQARSIKTALKESEKSSRYYEGRYRQGLGSIQDLLGAREQEMSVKNRLNALLAGGLKNRIDLAMALGVGLGRDGEKFEGGDR